MVSKINAVFRHIIGSESYQSTSTSRKRSSETLDDVSPDLLETPQAKRSRTSQHVDNLTNSHSSTPLLKVASWIRQKASSFGENYFFRPVGNIVERSYPAQIDEPTVGNNHRQPIKNKAMNQASGQKSCYISTGDKSRNHTGHASFKEPAGEPPGRKLFAHNSGSHPTKPCQLHNGHPDERDGVDQVHRRVSAMEGQPANTSNSHVQSRSSNPAPSSQLKQGNYVPIKDKLFPEASRRVVIMHNSRGPLHRPGSKLTALECVRLKERQQYEQLLQQYSIRRLAECSAMAAPESDASSNEPSKPEHTGARPKTTKTAQRHASHVQSSQLGTRILPHMFSTQHEIREAVRQRIHAPSSQLSPGSPSGTGPPPATPAQPDFNDSDSPIITSIKRAPVMETPVMSAFQRSVCATPYLTEDWVKDLKSRFESSMRLRQREIEEQKLKLQLYEERRVKGHTEAQELIKARIKRAEKEPGVVEDIIYRQQEEDEDDSIEVIDDDDDEDEEEEDDDEIEDEDEDEDAEELLELTPEMEDEIDISLHPHPASESLVSGFRLNITRRDMQTLVGLNWLNDEIMNFYFELLMERSNKENFPSLHYFNTFFYPKLVNSGYSSIRRWTKRTDIFSKDLVLVPVHLGMHWCLAVIDFRHKTIIFYDSMGSHNQQCLDALRDYVVSEHADKKKRVYSLDGWCYRSERGIPQQLNGSDCGMFACKYAEYISRDAPITFTQHDMPYFRRRMVWEILHKHLL